MIDFDLFVIPRQMLYWLVLPLIKYNPMRMSKTEQVVSKLVFFCQYLNDLLFIVDSRDGSFLV
jgi:hypothetical protein